MDKTTTYTSLYEKPNVVRKVIKSSGSHERKARFVRDKVLMYLILVVILILLVTIVSSFLKNNNEGVLPSVSAVLDDDVLNGSAKKEVIETKDIVVHSDEVAYEKKSSRQIEIDLKLDNLDEFRLDIGGDIQTHLENTLVAYKESKTLINLDENATIKKFNGKLKADREKVELSGKADSLESNGIRIEWDRSFITISTESGMIAINDFYFDEINFFGTGLLGISKGSLNLDNDNVVIKEFSGKIGLSKKQDGIYIHLDGSCKAFTINSDYVISGN